MLSTADQTALYSLLEESTTPVQVNVQLPVATQARESTKSRPKHLLVGADGTYPDPPKPNTWEARVLDLELAEGAAAVAWYRNPTGGRHALAIPYSGGTLYPDFLFFREVDGQVLIDIVDPHRPDLDDTKQKWVALSGYAATANAVLDEDLAGAARVDRVLAVIEDWNKELLAVNLAVPQAAAGIAAATGEDDIRSVFAQFGGRYRAAARPI